MQFALSRFGQFDAKVGVHLLLHECMPLTYMESANALTGLSKRFAAVPQLASILRRATRDYDEFQNAREYMRRSFAAVYRESPATIASWYRPEEFGKLVGVVNLWLVLHAPEKRGDFWRQQAFLALQSGASQYMFTIASSAKSAYVVINQQTIPDDATIIGALQRADHSSESSIVTLPY